MVREGVARGSRGSEGSSQNCAATILTPHGANAPSLAIHPLGRERLRDRPQYKNACPASEGKKEGGYVSQRAEVSLVPGRFLSCVVVGFGVNFARCVESSRIFVWGQNCSR